MVELRAKLLHLIGVEATVVACCSAVNTTSRRFEMLTKMLNQIVLHDAAS